MTGCWLFIQNVPVKQREIVVLSKSKISSTAPCASVSITRKTNIFGLATVKKTGKRGSAPGAVLLEIAAIRRTKLRKWTASVRSQLKCVYG